MQAEDEEKLESDIKLALNALLSTPGISPAETADKIYTIATNTVNTWGQRFPGGPNREENYGLSTPGLPTFLSYLWETAVDQLYNAPAEEEACREHITRLIELVRLIKGMPLPEGPEWLVMNEKFRWQDLPLIGITLREQYNGPFMDPKYWRSPDILLSQEAQSAMVGVYTSESQDLNSDTEWIGSGVTECRRNWLLLQHFIARLWSGCGCDEYDHYAIWAIRPSLEDWPYPPPSFDGQCESLEQSPGYLALEIEAAAIWICETAPLMYKCTGIWGPNGRPDWPENAGAPGRGGRRWDGVDGYDPEHKRWQLWKDVLGEIIQWCDGPEKVHMQGWKVKDAAIRALRALKTAEQE